MPDITFKESVLHDFMPFTLRFMLFAFLHSLLASRGVKRLACRESATGKAAYRLCYNLLSLTMFAWVMAADGCGRVLYFAPGAASLVMYLLQILDAVVLFFCLRQTGILDFLGIGAGLTSRLIDQGWYGLTRHPLYLLSILFLLLSPVMTAQRALLTTLATTYFVIGALLEERRLREEFGNRYRRYQQRVPFLLPFPRRPDTIVTPPRARGRERP